MSYYMLKISENKLRKKIKKDKKDILINQQLHDIFHRISWQLQFLQKKEMKQDLTYSFLLALEMTKEKPSKNMRSTVKNEFTSPKSFIDYVSLGSEHMVLQDTRLD